MTAAVSKGNTMQDKIDVIEKTAMDKNHLQYTRFNMILDINKAVQDLRDEIRAKLVERADETFDIGYNVAVEEVLALIGEKK